MGWLDRYVKRDAGSTPAPPSTGSTRTVSGRARPTSRPGPAGAARGRQGDAGAQGVGRRRPDDVPAGAGGWVGSSARSRPGGRQRRQREGQGAAPRARLFGSPRLLLTYSGRTRGGGRPQRLFAQIVDDATGTVLGNQITPIALRLDGRTHTTTHAWRSWPSGCAGATACACSWSPPPWLRRPRLGGRVASPDRRVAAHREGLSAHEASERAAAAKERACASVDPDPAPTLRPRRGRRLPARHAREHRRGGHAARIIQFCGGCAAPRPMWIRARA